MRDGAGFAPKAGNQIALLLRRKRRGQRQDLNGDMLCSPQIARFVDDGHASASKLPQKLIVLKGLFTRRRDFHDQSIGRFHNLP